MLDSREIVVVGGGIIGMAVAYGLAKENQRVIVLDEGDEVFRAARGNFGLVWVQGKGVDSPEYARWSVLSASLWQAFAVELAARSDVDLELSQTGGMRLALSDVDLDKQIQNLTKISAAIERPYPFESLNAKQIRELMPEVGPDVVGATYSPLDGHVSPLRLLRALVQAFTRAGGEIRTGEGVAAIQYGAGEFHVRTSKQLYVAGKVVLAAGLGNRNLAPMVGLDAPLHPERGQVIVTERVRPFLKYPTIHVRQTGEGVIQMGDSKEDVGFNDGTTVQELSRIAANAARYFPLLRNVNVVRTWGALRVMTPDGYPIYEASLQCPGAYLITCHSGVTLAANHAGAIADWIRTGAEPCGIEKFKTERFNVQTPES